MAAAAALAPAPVAAAIVTTAPAASAQTPPQGEELRTQWEINHSACDLNWDGGASVPLPGSPGRSLWLFGDYGIEGETGCDYKSVGTHAGVSNNTPGQVPVVGSIPTPGLHGNPGSPIGTLPNGTDRPARFLPNPTGLLEPDGVTPCANQASWYGGAAVGPDEDMTLFDEGTTPVEVHGSDLVFISYAEVCVIGAFGGPGERVSMAAWDPSINSFVARWTLWDGLTDSEPGVEVQALPIGSPIFIPGAGMVSFGSSCQSETVDKECLAGKTVMVGVAMDELHDPAGYKYFTGVGSGWSDDYDDAALMHPLATTNKGAYVSVVGDYTPVDEDFLMFEATDLYDGSYRIWQSSSLWTGWTLVDEGTMPNAVCNESAGAGLGCYQWQPHPEISTSSDLMFSVFDPASGEVEVSSLGALP